MEKHSEAVAAIARSVRRFHKENKQFRIYHGSTNRTRPAQFSREAVVDVSALNRVIKVDVERMVVVVEPNVPMDQLASATLACGCIPPVVMEFPGITVGGGFAGTSLESSSHRYGLFDTTVNWIEVILADGEIVIASDADRKDLLRGSAGTMGSLGVVTLLELKLEAAEKYVELKYLPFTSAEEAVDIARKCINEGDFDYVDGIMFSVNQGYVIAGQRTNILKAKQPLQRFFRARDPWFYRHAQKMLDQQLRQGAVEGLQAQTLTTPIYDYLFRYDRGAFWTGMYAFKYFITPFNRITRFILDPCMRTRVMYRALHAGGFTQNSYIIQDLAIPMQNATEFIRYVDRRFGIYPLWLCPLLHDKKKHVLPITYDASSSDYLQSEPMLLNIGIWGPGPSDNAAFRSLEHDLEVECSRLGGLKILYSNAYYSEDEFWRLCDRKRYEELRSRFGAESLPSVYDKVRQRAGLPGRFHDWPLLQKANDFFWAVWPMSGLYGVAKAVLGMEYMFTNSN